MATLSISVPDAVVSRIIAAYEAVYGPKGGLTNAQFLQLQILNWVRSMVAQHEAGLAAKTAAASATAQVTTDIP